VIVCSCNRISDHQLVETLASEEQPRTPGQAYRCLGCSPNCGRCLPLINQVLQEARIAFKAGCDACPAAAADEPLPLSLLDSDALPLAAE
jgi:bacterioferritin-associated ferredoxin